MNIAIIGYGQMGHKIEEAAKSRQFKVIARIDPNNMDAEYQQIDERSIRNADVCIDFSHPGSVLTNIKEVSRFEKKLVVGTTGWYDQLKEVKSIVQSARTGMIYAANFSLGMNLFYKIIESASSMFNIFDEYDVAGLELHHNKKADSPSGTAKTLVDIIIRNMSRKTKPLYNLPDGKIQSEELHFSSVRCGSIPGTHRVIFDSPADSIEVSHIVRNRDGFATGAILAAEWIIGRNGIFTFENLINNLLTTNKDN
jgi:4-hydroxy-tetrahydrodipicolinate reductase